MNTSLGVFKLNDVLLTLLKKVNKLKICCKSKECVDCDVYTRQWTIFIYRVFNDFYSLTGSGLRSLST